MAATFKQVIPDVGFCSSASLCYVSSYGVACNIIFKNIIHVGLLRLVIRRIWFCKVSAYFLTHLTALLNEMQCYENRLKADVNSLKTCTSCTRNG